MSDAAVAVAKQRRDGDSDIRTLSTGIRVRLRAVNASTITEVMAKLTPPKPPLWFNEKKGREEENPHDPYYQEQLDQFGLTQADTMMDTMALFGVELVDGLPDSDRWLKELRLLERRGRLDLSLYDLDDEIDREFLYKKHVVIGTADWSLIMSNSGISQEAIEAASSSFRSDQERNGNS